MRLIEIPDDGIVRIPIMRGMDTVGERRIDLSHLPTVNAFTAHEVAEILAEAFGDNCACNFNSNDEWLPEKCELLDSCPYPVGVACWEQFLKFRSAKMNRKDDT